MLHPDNLHSLHTSEGTSMILSLGEGKWDQMGGCSGVLNL